jgi:hypothetical protein
MHYKQLFWLHIKKSAGITARALLKPYYVEVERVKKPKTFIQATPEEYNDILNNFRVVLGKYQFKRCLFAKKYLYPNHWDNIYSFAFSREPVDRCISMFYYLFWKDAGYIRNILRSLIRSVNARKLLFNTSYAFDVFLDYAHEARRSNSIYQPLGIHFTTHTAPMWDDITDLDGNILLKEVFRLEKLIDGINKAFYECGIDKRLDKSDKKLNKNRGRKKYTPTQYQIKKIKQIYYNDFEIYEDAWH